MAAKGSWIGLDASWLLDHGDPDIAADAHDGLVVVEQAVRELSPYRPVKPDRFLILAGTGLGAGRRQGLVAPSTGPSRGRRTIRNYAAVEVLVMGMRFEMHCLSNDNTSLGMRDYCLDL
jgi:hypothetical protein